MQLYWPISDWKLCCRMQVSFIGPQHSPPYRKQAVYAIQGPEAGIDFAILDVIQSSLPTTLPLLSALTQLQSPRTSQLPASGDGDAAIQQAVEIACNRFHLNEEQSAALTATSRWFQGPVRKSPPLITCLLPSNALWDVSHTQ